MDAKDRQIVASKKGSELFSRLGTRLPDGNFGLCGTADCAHRKPAVEAEVEKSPEEKLPAA